MRFFYISICCIAIAASATAFAANDIAPTGTLRAAYLASNPAQARRSPETGEIRGASADLARELGRKLGVPVVLIPSQSPATVIAAVANDEADIGFVAFAPERAGPVAFSQTYMLVWQSFLVPEHSTIQSAKDIDQIGLRLGGGKGDSITLYLARTLKQATLVETDNTAADAIRRLTVRDIDAFGANRQRLLNMLAENPGYRLLPDSLFGVPQTIAVPVGRPDALTQINQFIDEARQSGFLGRAIANSGVAGIEVAPAQSDRR